MKKLPIISQIIVILSLLFYGVIQNQNAAAARREAAAYKQQAEEYRRLFKEASFYRDLALEAWKSEIRAEQSARQPGT